jgi:two-component system chemotaxis response regulator CheB
VEPDRKVRERVVSIRVLIVDDSPFVREIICAGLARHPDIEVVGQAGDGRTAERLIGSLRPDVVTMDVVMPLVSGLDAIRNIMANQPTPIVVVSDARGGKDRLMVEAIAAGAIEVFVKPPRGFDDRAADQLANVLRSAAKARLASRRLPRAATHRAWDDTLRQLASASVIGIVASTGGPAVLHQLIHALPATFKVPIAIVQHTAVGFTDALVSWLGQGAAVRVEIARAGAAIRGVVVAPDDQHLEVRRGTILLHRDPPVRGHRPSGTVLLQALAAYGRAAVGIVCTGMNDDGAVGLGALEAAGGIAIVEDPQTAVIDAMPRAAIAATESPIVATASRISDLLAGGG